MSTGTYFGQKHSCEEMYKGLAESKQGITRFLSSHTAEILLETLKTRENERK